MMGAGVLTRCADGYDPPWPPRRYWLTADTLLCYESERYITNDRHDPSSPSVSDDLLRRTKWAIAPAATRLSIRWGSRS